MSLAKKLNKSNLIFNVSFQQTEKLDLKIKITWYLMSHKQNVILANRKIRSLYILYKA